MPRRPAAAAQLVASFDSPLLRALAEPARHEILRVLILHGTTDIQTIASHLPQDRSVVSRHLKTLVEGGVVAGRREGRNQLYAVDAPTVVSALERLSARVKRLAPLCCRPLPADGIRPAAR